MKKQIAFSLAAVGLLTITSVLLLKQQAPRTREITSAPTAPSAMDGAAKPPAPPAVTPKPKPETALTVAHTADNPTQTGPFKAAIDLNAPVDPAKRAEAVSVLAEQKALYADVGTLSWNETKALVARRQKAAEELVSRLAKLGPGGARAIADVYFVAEDTRARLLLVGALGRVSDPEATAVLDALMGYDSSFSVRKEMVAALGQRGDRASSAVLTGLLQTQDDARLRALCVQALSGRAEALPLLAACIRTDTSQDVRLESVRSVSLIGNQAAKDELAGIAKGPLETGVRQAAIQELVRSFGAGALGVFDELLSDPEENIRMSTVKGIARIHTDQAVAMLRRTASSDTPSATRELAKQSLPPSQLR